MAQYIDKDALVAEIERRYGYWREKESNFHSIESETRMSECQHLMLLLNTLEVKEVDLEKVIEEYFKGWTDDYDNGGAACHYQYVQVSDCKAIAKHFFELGLKTQKGE